MPKGSVGITEQFANIYTFESLVVGILLVTLQRKFLIIKI